MNRQLTIAVTFILFMQGCISTTDLTQGDNTDDAEYPMLELPQKIRASPSLENFDDCDLLLQTLQQNLYEEMLTLLDQQSYYTWSGLWFADDSAVPETSMDGDSTSGTAMVSPRDGDFSGTNNQESGVDEADFLKTDGYHTYMLNGGLLLIMEIPEFGEIELIASLPIEGDPIAMMIEGGKMVIASSVYGWMLPEGNPLRELIVRQSSNEEASYAYEYYKSNLVKYTILDMDNKSNPIVEQEVYFEGNYNTARLVQGTVRSITHFSPTIEGISYYVDVPYDFWRLDDTDERMTVWNNSLQNTISANIDTIMSLSLEDIVPMRYALNSDREVVTLPYSDRECSDYAASTDSVAKGFLTIATMDISNIEVSIEVDHIASSWAHVYSSEDALVLAEPANDWWWFWGNDDYEDATNIHMFDISEIGSTSYVGSGRVSGTVQDQFSISEYEGIVRVASTTDAWGRWWITTETDPITGLNTFTGPSNRVTNLLPDGSGSLNQIGIIEGIADGERIWSSRFVGDRAYLVTFETIDPLWVLDMSDPENPEILGELEVPGVSTYIHPIDENTLLTIGIGPGQDGLGLDWSTTQVSLFDISNPYQPALADSLKLTPAYADVNCLDVWDCGWSWSTSEATYEHKAFTYWPENSVLAVPLSTYRYTHDEYGIGEYEYVSLMKLVSVDTQNLSLAHHGDVNHSGFYNDNPEDVWWHHYSTSIRRSIFMGDFVYAFSALGVTAHETESLAISDQISIPGYNLTTGYY